MRRPTRTLDSYVEGSRADDLHDLPTYKCHLLPQISFLPLQPSNCGRRKNQRRSDMDKTAASETVKKTRKSVKREKTGCITCKIRRVKCDGMSTRLTPVVPHLDGTMR